MRKHRTEVLNSFRSSNTPVALRGPVSLAPSAPGGMVFVMNQVWGMELLLCMCGAEADHRVHLLAPTIPMKNLDPLSTWLLRIRAPLQPRHDNSKPRRTTEKNTAAGNEPFKHANQPQKTINPALAAHAAPTAAVCSQTLLRCQCRSLQSSEEGRQPPSEIKDVDKEDNPARVRPEG